MANHNPKYRNKSSAGAVIVAMIVIVGALFVLVLAALNIFSPKEHSSIDEDIVFTDSINITDPPYAEDVIITTGSKETYVLAGQNYIEPSIHAYDPNSGDITSTIKSEGEVDTTRPGDYEVVYTAYTPNGEVSKATRTVHVRESFDELGGEAATIPVLMYHYVYTDQDKPASLNGNYLLDTKLREQCEYLQSSGYYYPSFEELRAFVDGTHSLPAKSVILTFDDAEAGFLKYGIPVLNEYEVPATSFVICSDVDAAEKITKNASEYVQFQSHTFNMHRDGSSVGQGGVIHALSKQEIYDDVVKSQGILGTHEALAYPFGDNNETSWAALKDAGVLCAFTVKNARISPGDNPYALNRVRISGEYVLDGFKSLVSPDGISKA